MSCAPVFAQQTTIAHFENIEDWRISARNATDAPDVPAMSARFSAFGRAFELELERNSRIEALLTDNVTTARAFRGELRNLPDSWVRLVESANGLAGLIFDGVTLYGVEPNNGSATIFRADDVRVPAGTMSCGMHAPAANAGQMFAALALEVPPVARAAGATLNLDLGIVSDPELGALYADPEAEMLIRINNVDGIYSAQLGVQLSVQQVDVFNDSGTDPFTNTTDAGDLLDELAVYRGDTATQDAQGLTHLFTGRDLDDSTVGIAYIGAVCAQRSVFDPDGRSFGVGLTQANFGPGAAFLESLIAAHEIGHNFGAPHDGDSDEACAAEPSSGFIMAASLDPSADDFSQCSIDVMTANLPGFSCLSALPVVDVSLSGQSSATPLTETQFSYVVTANNSGLQTATNTSVQLDFDAGLSVVSLTPESGTCGAAQSSVTCTPGDIPASSTRTINVVLQSATPGDYSISGSVTATDDVNAGNNDFADTVSVAAASDLALVTNTVSLTENQTDTVNVSLENRSGVDASNIVLSGTWSSGLEVDSVAFAGGNCTLDSAALSFNCQIAALAGLTNGQLSMVLRGVETGAQVVTLNVSALEADPNAANNSSNLNINIIAASAPPASSDPVAQDDGGGGGSLSPLALLALLGAWRRSRRSISRRNANFS